MQRTAWGYRPETRSRDQYEPPVHRAYGRHAGYFDSEQHTHPRDAMHTVQGMGSTCNYNVYSYQDQHTRQYAEDKYNVYNKYGGDAPGGARAWEQTQPGSAYGSYACHNQSQYARHDGIPWLQTPLAKCGQQNVPDEQAGYTGQYARHDGSPWLPTPQAKCGQQNVPDEQAASGGQYARHDGSAWLPTPQAKCGQQNVQEEQAASGGQCERPDWSTWLATVLAKYGQENVPDEQAARTGQYATHDGSAQLSSWVREDGQHKENEEQAALQGLCDTEKEGMGTKQLIETLATVRGRQGDERQADEQERSVKKCKLYDPDNVQPLDDYDIEDWEL